MPPAGLGKGMVYWLGSTYYLLNNCKRQTLFIFNVSLIRQEIALSIEENNSFLKIVIGDNSKKS